MTQNERSLILFFETCVVDQCGEIDSQHINQDDFRIAKRWTREGFINFQRIPFAEIKGNRTGKVQLSDKAWEAAHKERRARGERHVETIGAG